MNSGESLKIADQKWDEIKEKEKVRFEENEHSTQPLPGAKVFGSLKKKLG